MKYKRLPLDNPKIKTALNIKEYTEKTTKRTKRGKAKPYNAI